MFFNSSINPAAGIAMALSNMYLRKQFQPDKNVVNGYSIVTTGQEWQLFRVDSNLNLKKTIILEGTKDTFRSIYHDEEIVATVMGMLEYSLEIPPENV